MPKKFQRLLWTAPFGATFRVDISSGNTWANQLYLNIFAWIFSKLYFYTKSCQEIPKFTNCPPLIFKPNQLHKLPKVPLSDGDPGSLHQNPQWCVEIYKIKVFATLLGSPNAIPNSKFSRTFLLIRVGLVDIYLFLKD